MGPTQGKEVQKLYMNSVISINEGRECQSYSQDSMWMGQSRLRSRKQQNIGIYINVNGNEGRRNYLSQQTLIIVVRYQKRSGQTFGHKYYAADTQRKKQQMNQKVLNLDLRGQSSRIWKTRRVDIDHQYTNIKILYNYMLQFRRTIFDQNEDAVHVEIRQSTTSPFPLQQQGNVLMKQYDKFIPVQLEICPERLYKRLSPNQLVYCTLDKCRLRKFTFYDQVLPHHKFGIALQQRDQQETFLIDSADEFRKWFLLFKRYCVLDKFKQKFKVLNKSKLEDPLFGQCYFNCIHSNNYKLVKIIDKANITNYQLQCLSKEISSLRKLSSPLVIFFNELYEDDTNIYIVYNHYQGLDMRSWLKENSQNLEERLVAQIMFNLLTAISHMHARGVFHRDIKLDSILIQSQLPSVLLTNFCYSETYIPQTPFKKCGTPGFIAPEIFKTKLYTPKADMFSLGCLFYVLYFGKIPFSGSSQEEILSRNEAALKKEVTLQEGVFFWDKFVEGSPDRRSRTEAVGLIGSSTSLVHQDGDQTVGKVPQEYYKGEVSFNNN
ncbi:unnamed protein product (macronuclear) [Paramecium tetraurelia]|uniref:Protein kinase domain-containing protein n=1 Tax=Paramecium tetraurelia TaxID=5888 RepID=A0CT03_PARTE|nr:uncharacterized protein GSPATT00038938001 [Paramecium tetraurelia]CAK73920.1 unnamed protein product [Paramecium tetraurelia]|eukprot:XP_001441317.1 hypothetical protein (macronuclear) [Paramecium tetraurelia strain d4-2]